MITWKQHVLGHKREHELKARNTLGANFEIKEGRAHVNVHILTTPSPANSPVDGTSEYEVSMSLIVSFVCMRLSVCARVSACVLHTAIDMLRTPSRVLSSIHGASECEINGASVAVLHE